MRESRVEQESNQRIELTDEEGSGESPFLSATNDGEGKPIHGDE